jgi:hypothetical protein
VQLHFLVTCADKMIDDVRRRGVATGTAEPLATSKALDDAARVVDATVCTGVCGEFDPGFA